MAPRLGPLPEPFERTQHRWQVNGDAGLCLLRDAIWTSPESGADLLLKAAGWRIEYALMKHQTIDQMTGSGIVSDHRLDHFLAHPRHPRTPRTALNWTSAARMVPRADPHRTGRREPEARASRTARLVPRSGVAARRARWVRTPECGFGESAVRSGPSLWTVVAGTPSTRLSCYAAPSSAGIGAG
ncbi:hypothetical protein B0E38_07230 [Streptomyces sp. 111WW2]|nr:hypothetical protein B0E38_07230 [Streptomyces sp. 111WW2]BDD77206.1 hypothetical protein JCM4020_78260 [Streptomyces coelicolor]